MMADLLILLSVLTSIPDVDYGYFLLLKLVSAIVYMDVEGQRRLDEFGPNEDP
jgi:hypothetical protein